MKVTFADTFYYLAMLNPGDAAHQQAMQATEQLRGGLLTTEFVLLEVADALSLPRERSKFLELFDYLTSTPEVVVVPTSSELLRRGVELYRRRPDKDWPLTDCISFVVMERNAIAEALTGDNHFRQAGFKPLLAGA
ncbi:MAG: PIN domain-containing protein [Tepidisphaeraceae bacterium]|jgi:predicted nucleic acid-binding protein